MWGAAEDAARAQRQLAGLAAVEHLLERLDDAARGQLRERAQAGLEAAHQLHVVHGSAYGVIRASVQRVQGVVARALPRDRDDVERATRGAQPARQVGLGQDVRVHHHQARLRERLEELERSVGRVGLFHQVAGTPQGLAHERSGGALGVDQDQRGVRRGAGHLASLSDAPQPSGPITGRRQDPRGLRGIGRFGRGRGILAVMYCQACGAKNTDDARFCNMCGSSIAAVGTPGGPIAAATQLGVGLPSNADPKAQNVPLALAATVQGPLMTAPGASPAEGAAGAAASPTARPAAASGGIRPSTTSRRTRQSCRAPRATCRPP
jgi:hypothetical protein